MKISEIEFINKLEDMIQGMMIRNDEQRKELFPNQNRDEEIPTPTLESEHLRGFNSGLEVGCINANAQLLALKSMIKVFNKNK